MWFIVSDGDEGPAPSESLPVRIDGADTVCEA